MNISFYKYLLRFYLFSILVLSILRSIFLLYYYQTAFKTAWAEILHSFCIGFIIDSSVVSITIIITLLISLISGFFSEKSPLIFFRIAFTLICISFFVNLIDIFYFEQFGVRLNQYALQEYQSPETILPMIYNEYPVIWIMLLLVLFFYSFFRLCLKYFRLLYLNKTVNSFKWITLSFLSFFFLSFIYYDGPFWKLTSFSSSSLLNQMSSNGVYTFIKSVEQSITNKNTLTIFPEIPDSSSLSFIKNISVHNDEISIPGKFPTQRKFKSPLPKMNKNIVIIICESFSASNIGVLGGKSLSPQFDSWSKKGLLFTHCYSNGPRTHFGITSVVSGFPAIIGSSLIRRKGPNEFNTLGNILNEEGYETNFFYGGDASFDDMELFMHQGGFDQIFDIDNFKSYRYKNAMGVCDEDLFNKAYSEIFQTGTPPTLSVILTVSNHAPHQVPNYFMKSNPEVKKMSLKESTFYYADYSLGKFLDQCSKNPQFNNTVFLILADHGEVYDLKDQNYKVYHIPALLLNSNQPVGNFDSVCSQIDFAPTLLNEIGYEGIYHFIGQNLFSNYYKSFSISRNTETALAYHYENIVYFTDLKYGGDSYYYLDSLSYPSIKFEPSLLERNKTQLFLKNYLEGLSVIYRDGFYQYKNLKQKNF